MNKKLYFKQDHRLCINNHILVVEIYILFLFSFPFLILFCFFPPSFFSLAIRLINVSSELNTRTLMWICL